MSIYAASELAVLDANVRSFKAMVADNSLMNMLFYGMPGTGKTSAARVLLDKLDVDILKINGSIQTGVDQVRSIEEYARTVSIYGQTKVCFIAEFNVPLIVDSQTKREMDDSRRGSAIFYKD